MQVEIDPARSGGESGKIGIHEEEEYVQDERDSHRGEIQEEEGWGMDIV